MLARDALGKPCPDGGTWRGHHLGLDDATPAPVPVLLRLADLLPLFEGSPAVRRDDRRRLLDLLEAVCRENGYGVERGR